MKTKFKLRHNVTPRVSLWIQRVTCGVCSNKYWFCVKNPLESWIC